MIIALDAMSGDHGVMVSVSAAQGALRRFPELELILVGQPDVLQPLLEAQGLNAHPRLRVQAASEVVGMDEEPGRALRGKKDSSMRVAINLVQQGQAQACVSAGNTGALMATARFVLKMLPGVDRPAIVSAIPSLRGHTHMLDLGANAECSPEQLFQFAVMGAVLVRAVANVERPRVALLNIGSEEIKGTTSIKSAAALIAASDLDYAGFVEGDDIFLGDVDVVVCDGFSGNVALKSAEGIAHLIAHFLGEEYRRSWYGKLAGLVSMPVLKRFKQRVDPGRYNGASLLGLNGIVVKSHGGADARALEQTIAIAVLEINKGVTDRIRSEVAAHLLAPN